LGAESILGSVLSLFTPDRGQTVGSVVGPVMAVISFVCSVRNVPLAAVLWNSGISFGGVIAFIFADLIVIPILDIYRKYYGVKVMLFILTTFYAAMFGGALAIEFLFQALGLIPGERKARVVEATISWNYTTVLNICGTGIPNACWNGIAKRRAASKPCTRFLKHELGAGVLPSKRFGADAAWFRVAVITHNLLTGLKRLALLSAFLNARPKRLRFLIFTTPARLVEHARHTTLRMVRSWNRFTNWLPVIRALPAPVL